MCATSCRKGPTGADFRHEEVLPTCLDQAVSFIEEWSADASEAPFFIYFPLPAPHTPILPTADYQGRSGTNEYGDFVLQVDGTVGRIMDALERCGVADNTLLVFTSDNGCSPRADYSELAQWNHCPSYHFRGHKADIFEGGHRIPFIARWPGVIPAGSFSDEIICLTDLLATCADILDVELPDDAGEDSVSNLPALRGESREQPLREATVHHSINGSFSIRQGKWKLEMCPGSGGWSHPKPDEAKRLGLPPVQLYDMEQDVRETTNLQAEHPEIVARLSALLESYQTQDRSVDRGR
jgi:arylsulfatase A-like enzyme